MKELVKKTSQSGDINSPEFLDGLLEWRNTPRAEGFSPAQLVFGHPLRTKLPSHPSALESKGKPLSTFIERKTANNDKIKAKFDQVAQTLSTLDLGSKVRVQNPISKKWDIFGEVEQLKHRRYLIRLDTGRVYWRNRRFLRLDKTEATNSMDDSASSPGKKCVSINDDATVHAIPPRRSTRRRQKPDRLNL